MMGPTVLPRSRGGRAVLADFPPKADVKHRQPSQGLGRREGGRVTESSALLEEGCHLIPECLELGLGRA